MARQISQRELRNESGAVMRALDDGEEFIVTRNGVPVGRLVPMERRQFVPKEQVLEAFRGAPSIDYEQFRRDLDRWVDPGFEPRE